ncbi:MAG: AbrB/MazE/SpoVT family DNA-binding domain-containing protein [Planctomycetales bacterium]|nr:AbrB/MazE/SpoVT family DNA-binding domain-containing protein [Planctomycetales bacterium]
MLTRVRKWGNSLGIRIPRDLARGANVSEGIAVDLAVKGGALVVRRARRSAERVYRLSDLLARVRAKQLHPETDWGRPVGRESL